MSLEIYTAAAMAAHQAYIAGSRDQAGGKFDPDGWVAKLHADGIEGFDAVVERDIRFGNCRFAVRPERIE
jgi:hypothetical protein